MTTTVSATVVQVGTPDELFERPGHTFVGYFIGSPGMNVIPVDVEGDRAMLDGLAIALPGVAPAGLAGGTELGIRPEFVSLSRQGMPVSIRKVEDLGRRKVVWAGLQGRDIALIAGEDEEIPAEPRIVFDPGRINLYAASRRVELERAP